MTNSASFIISDSGIASLRNLIAIRRSLDGKFSYSYISKKIGIKSRSYLSEAVKGQKKLNEKHIDPIVSLLELPEAEAELLKNKLLLECGDLSPAEVVRLTKAIADSTKKFSSGNIELTEVRDINLVMILSICVCLFKDEKPDKRQIIELFGRDRFYEVERALSDLVRNGILVKDGDSYRHADNFHDVLHIYSSTNRKHEMDYLRSSMTEALEYLESGKRSPESSVFYSGMITTDMMNYLQSMDFIKQSLRSIQSRVESREADSILRFNIQLYPIIHKEKP